MISQTCSLCCLEGTRITISSCWESMGWQSQVRHFDNTYTVLNTVANLCCGVCYYPKLIHFLKSVSYLQACTVVTFDAAPASLLLHFYIGNTTPSTTRNWRKMFSYELKHYFNKNHPRNQWYFNVLSNFIWITVSSLTPSSYTQMFQGLYI